MKKEIECRVTGRVQRVMYRDYALRTARRLGIDGFVENESDGSVHVIAQGDESKLTSYISLLQRGSIFSRVQEVDVDWKSPSRPLSGFSIRYKNLFDRL